jgi:hypothetical protein
VPDGALSRANDGSAIGVGVGELVGAGVGLGVGVVDGEGLGDVPALGWLVHAVRARTRIRRSNARIPLSLSCLQASCI